MISPKLRLAGTVIGMVIEESHKGLQPSLSHLHVAVEQHIILCFNLFERLVVALSKTIVAVEHDETYLRKAATQQVEQSMREPTAETS